MTSLGFEMARVRTLSRNVERMRRYAMPSAPARGGGGRSHCERGIGFWLGRCYCGEFWSDGAKTEVVVGENGVKGNEEHGELDRLCLEGLPNVNAGLLLRTCCHKQLPQSLYPLLTHKKIK